MAMAEGPQDTTSHTLALLEERLRLIDYVLNGHSPGEDTLQNQDANAGNATARLRALERTLNSLASNSPSASAILSLQKEHPVVFNGSYAAKVPPSLSTDSLAALVVAHAQLFNATSSNLAALKDTPVPNSSEFAKVVNLRTKIQELATKQEAQATEFAALRARSAIVVEKWYEGGVLEMGERWAAWEERLRSMEILVRRREAAKRREQEGIV